MAKRSLTKALIIIAIALANTTATIAACTYEQNLQTEEFPVGLMLSWSTASEINNSMFVIEKSDDGFDFMTVGNIKGSGNTRISKKYNFLDAQPSNKRVYYRLKQVDFDGTYSYSEVLKVEKRFESRFMVVQLKNEVVNRNFDFTIDALTEAGAVLKLTDASGKPIWQSTQSLMAGLNNISIDMSTHNEGVYKVSVLMENDEKVLTIRKTFDEVEK
ncbi:MAG TPA: hypothetical protein V6C58_19575, partial [Allocoleopsis sp.]